MAASKFTKIITAYSYLAPYTVPMYFHILLLLIPQPWEVISSHYSDEESIMPTSHKYGMS